MALKEDLGKAIDLGYFRALSRLRVWLWISYLVPAVAVVAWIAVKHRGLDWSAYSAGPVARVHASFGERCESCHTPASQGRPIALVTGEAILARKPMNEGCLVCHGAEIAADASTATALHARPFGAAAPEEPFLSCASCHVEHEGAARLSEIADAACARCHADLASHRLAGSPRRVRPVGDRIRSIAEHGADFIALESRDPSHVRFDHAAHLKKPVLGPGATRVRLVCADCHENRPCEGRFARAAAAHEGAVRDERPGTDRPEPLMREVRFSRHCAGCHSLGVDERLAGDGATPLGAVPHEAPALIRSWLRGQLLALSEVAPASGSRIGLVEPRAPEATPAVSAVSAVSSRVALASPREPRRAPRPPGQPIDGYRGPADPAGRPAWVEGEVAAIESRLYASPGGTCVVCHEVPAGASMLPLEPAPHAQIPGRWLEKARFDHGRHEQVACAACHRFRRPGGATADASESASASDVLLAPGIAGCKTCHAPLPGDDRSLGPSRCTTCHTYHRASPHRGGR